MSALQIFYLGPPGTFTHEVARKRFGRQGATFRDEETVMGVCEKVAGSRGPCKGIIPIDNSTGGTIYTSVDALLDDRLDLHIQEEIALNVSLALIGRPGEEIRRLYTHFAPMRHCKQWIESRHPDAELIEVSSTAVAARDASREPHAAAISNRMAAPLYGLHVLEHPIPTSIPTNVTHFFVIASQTIKQPRISKTSLALRLHNTPGSLYDFLRPLADARINLSRIISRPIEGKPREFAFLIDVDDDVKRPRLSVAMQQAGRHCAHLRILGSYPCFRTYRSQ